jgi:aspartyl-tRNA(Asn)/glutamyl-tRNA(Gln) amidotransferase subunit A
MSERNDLTLSETSRALAEGALSSRELCDYYLERTVALDERLGAYLRLSADEARGAADRADERRARGESLGPLDGVPIALKDNLVTEGVETTSASRILEGWTPPYDATVVRRLKEAGAVLLGKLNCDELAMGSSNENSAYRTCRNPWDLSRAPGGSSGGSAAAVAAGLCAGALGSDTGGSIRQPAAFCGVVGLKPTYGRVSRFGLVAFASSLDQIGPLTRDVEGAALLGQAIAGFDERDSTSVERDVGDWTADLDRSLDGVRVGVPAEYVDAEGLDADVRVALDDARRALQARGATIVDVSLPHTQYAIATYYLLCTAEASSNLARLDGVRYGPRRGKGDLRELYETTRGELFGPEVKRRILLGTWVLSAGYYDAYYRRAQRVRARIAEDFATAFTDVDTILCPTSPVPAFELGERTQDPLTMYLADAFTVPASLAGLPAVSLNAGFAGELPLGVQLVGRAFEEPSLLGVARQLEDELGVHHRRPPDPPTQDTETT